MIWLQRGIPAKNQSLPFEGQQLEEDFTLWDYGIEQGSVIELVVNGWARTYEVFAGELISAWEAHSEGARHAGMACGPWRNLWPDGPPY